MRRTRTGWIASLSVLVLLLGSSLPARADAPICALAPRLEAELLQSDALVGVAVVDLQTETVWSGGVDGPFAMHSMVKPAIAWAVMTDAHEQGRELTRLQRDALFYMIAWSQNADVDTLLGMIGELRGLSRYYERLGVSELAALQHENRWGSGRSRPVDLAQLFAALAESPQVPDPVRADGFDLLRQTVDQHLWGATIPARRLIGWESLIKTGNFILAGPVDQNTGVGDDPRGSNGEDIEPAEPHTDLTPEADPDTDKEQDDEQIVRMNSAAIWLDAPWLGGRPQFVIAIMQESRLTWSRSRALQNELGAILANAVADRLVGASENPSAHCLKRALY
ncbi:MAG: hypothetical protein OXH38_02265 [Chloroflexi bacterium]|nr:hypothetical protein [Chloroflexota bacterium]